MAIQYDPRLQGKPNTTDILTGQEDLSQQPQEGSQTPPQPQGNAQPAQPQENSPQSNLAKNKPKSSSGMFTNVRQYVEKNQPAAENMAKSIGSTVQRSADIARKNIQASQSQFGNLMEQGSLGNRESAVQDVRTAAERAAGMSAPQQAQVGQATGGQRSATGAAPQVQITDQNQAQQSDADARIKSILDAQYKGPQRLEELGSFGQAQTKAQEAERLKSQLTGGNRQELLDKALERRGSQYTQGARRLDELLFGQGNPQQMLQQTQQQIGDVGQDLSSASQSARQDAINRARELSDIRSQAREALQSTATGRAGEVQSAIDAQIAAGGELADYYKNLLSDSEGGLDLGSVEAQTLGVQSGAGLYNLLRDEQERESLLGNLDARDQLDAQKLISRDEQAQLAELQRLAQLSGDYGVADSGLDFRTQYQDADLAGTQDALSALNLEGFGDALTEAETRFREQAARDVTGIGTGKAKFQKGFGRGRGKVKKTAYETANLKDILEAQGYDFESDPSQYVSETDPNLLTNLSNIASQVRSEGVDVSDPMELMDYASSMGGEDSVLFNNQVMDSLGLSGLGKVGTVGGALNTSGELVSSMGDTAKQIGDSPLGDIPGVGFAAENVGNLLGSLGNLKSDISTGIFGGGKGDAKKKAAAKAQRAALSDLQRKLTGSLSSSGFSNRVNVADTEETTERQRQLLDILGGIRNN
jgi:hypothetical protein